MPAIAIALLLTAVAPDAAVATPAQEIVEPNPREMSRSEIREHNAQLANDHPYFIRCVRTEAIGSLIARNVSCRTNQRWVEAEDAGNQEARDIGDEMRSKSWNTSN